MVLSFIKQEKYKLLATTLVAGFFLYFWIQGPIIEEVEVVALEHEENKYSAPKMVGDDDSSNTGGSIKDNSYGIIVSEADSERKNGERSKQLLAHAAELKEGKQKIGLTESLMFVEIESKEGSFTYFESKDIINDIHGYAGPVNIGVLVNEYGRINQVVHISSQETKSYLEKIHNGNYYESYEDLRLSGEHTINAISGATLTSQAIASTTTALLNKGRPEPLTTRSFILPGDTFTVKAELDLFWIAHILVIFALFVYGIQKKWRKTKTGILVISILSVVYIGFFLNNSFTYISFLHPFLGTSVSSLVGLYALLTLLGAIWGKNTYCKYVCPFGNVQRLIMRFGPNKKKRFFLPNKWIKRIRGGLTIALIIGILLGLRSWSNFELFPDLFGFQYLSAWFFIAVATVALTSIYPMIWCRLLCPTGSILDFISDAVNYKRKRKKTKDLTRSSL